MSPRPSRKTDERLIGTAQKLMKDSALSQLNLRQVAAAAGVNLGMFHYHFKTKDQFIKAVLKDTYEKFFVDFSLQVEGETEPLEKLRQALVTLARFSRDNRHLVLSLLHDALNRDPSVKDFVRQSMAKHAHVIVGLIQRCQREGALQKGPLPLLMSYIMTASSGSSMALGLMEHLDAEPATIEQFKQATTDQALARRVDWVLAGLAPEAASAPKKTKKSPKPSRQKNA